MTPLEPFETWTREARRQAQWRRLAGRLAALQLNNAFYRRKLDAAGIADTRDLSVIEDGLHLLPFTTKTELSDDAAAHPPFGTNMTYPIEKYVMFVPNGGCAA